MKNSLAILFAVIYSALNLFAVDALPAIPAVSLKTIDTKLSTSQTHRVELAKGWNMVSVPGYDTINMSELFSNSTYVNVVYYFDPSINNYTSYMPHNTSSQLTSIKPSQGIWVYANIAFSLTFNASVDPAYSSSSSSSLISTSSNSTSSSSSSVTSSQSSSSSTAANLNSARLIADYNFNNSLADTLNPDSVLQTLNTKFVDNAIYSNGIYRSTFASDTIENGSYIITPVLENFSYDNFTINLRFKPLDTGTILVGGTDYRWFFVNSGYSNSLEIYFNNYSDSFTISNANVKSNEWNTLIISVDTNNKKVITYLNDVKLEDITLPSTFKYEVVNSSQKENDKKFTFSNFSSGLQFKGYVDYLKIYNGSLTN